jgi:hypothetical protein
MEVSKISLFSSVLQLDSAQLSFRPSLSWEALDILTCTDWLQQCLCHIGRKQDAYDHTMKTRLALWVKVCQRSGGHPKAGRAGLLHAHDLNLIPIVRMKK